MKYAIVLSNQALKQLSKLPDDVQHRINSVLLRIRIRPYSYLKKMVGSPYFSLRVGDYRIIVRMIDNKLVILVINIKHRKNAYK